MSQVKRIPFITFLAAAATAIVPASASGDGDIMELRAILETALEANPNLAAKELAAAALVAEERSTAGHFGPVLRAEVAGMLWDSDNIYRFDTSGFDQLFQQMGAPPGTQVPPMEVTVRDDLTLKASIMVIQPLVQLWKIGHGYRARSHAAEAGRHDVVSSRRDLELQVVQAFFSHLGARQMLDSVGQAERQIAAIEKQTRDYLDNGLLAKDALLKVLVQREELAKNRLAAEKGIALTRATLNMLMARPLDQPLEVMRDDRDDHERPGADTSIDRSRLNELQDQAVRRRPELLSAREQLAAAKAAEDAEVGNLLPDLNFVAAYTRNEGMGDLMLKDEVFGGLVLEWNIWDWGANYNKVRAAGLRAQQAAASVSAAEDGTRLQVHQRVLELEEARKRRDVAEAALELAQENLRLEQNKYGVQQTAAADLLAAQTGELRARNDRTVAMMQVEMARRALQIASGSDLLDASAVDAARDTEETTEENQ